MSHLVAKSVENPDHNLNSGATNPSSCTENGRKMSQHKLLSSMSSYESDTDVYLTNPPMKLLNVSYSPQPPSAGDVLMAGDPEQSTSNPQYRRSSHTEGCRRSRNLDEVDSGHTRGGQILFDKENQDAAVSDLSTSNNSSIHSSASYGSKNKTKVTCRASFCILFQCQHICSRFSIFDLVPVIGSIGLYFFDLVTDILNGLSYYYNRDKNKDNMFYFIVTMIVIVVPSLIMQAFSIWWEVEDISEINKQRKNVGKPAEKRCYKHLFLFIVHLLQLGPIYRYFRAIQFGLKSRRREIQGNESRWKFYNNLWKYQLSDVSFLRVMESYLEAAPQVVLQIYIMVTTMQTPFITVLSCCVSIFGMSLMIVTWQRHLRDSIPESKKQISICGSLVLFLYRTCTITSRVFALALLLNVHVWAWIALFAIHWVICTIYIICQNTKLCNSRAQEYIYNVVIGFCYTFAYINVHTKQDSNNRYRMAVYYFLIFLENVAISMVWFYFRQGGGSLLEVLLGSNNSFSAVNVTTATEAPVKSIAPNIAIGFVFAVNGLFIVGILFMLVYYMLLHPTNGGPCCNAALVNIGELNTGEATGLTASAVAARSNYNLREKRSTSQFHSWHSTSLTYEEIDNKIKKRPSSDILPQTAFTYGDEQPLEDNKRVSAVIEVNSAACSCYSLRNTALGYQPIKTQSPSSSKLLSSPSIVNQPVQKHRVDEAERKRRYFTQLIQQKRELEHQQAMLKLNMDRQFSLGEHRKLTDHEPMAQSTALCVKPKKMDKIQDFATTQSTMTPTRKHLKSRNRLHSLEESPTHSAPPSFSHGTFPRYSRSSMGLRSHQKSGGLSTMRKENYLKPISENKTIAHTSAGMRDYSASLSNLTVAMSRSKQKVPRAMSFTVKKDEVIESMESSV
ncbi:XK-related a [Ciona intestinalis]